MLMESFVVWWCSRVARTEQMPHLKHTKKAVGPTAAGALPAPRVASACSCASASCLARTRALKMFCMMCVFVCQFGELLQL